MFMLALAEATLLSCRLTPMLLSRVLTSFNPIRGLLVMDSGRGPLGVYVCSSIFLVLERRGLQTLPVL